MKELFGSRLVRLLCVKSLVTLTLTAVFAVMACTGKIDQDFMTVYTVIIAFYFGTQTERKNQTEREDTKDEVADLPSDGK